MAHSRNLKTAMDWTVISSDPNNPQAKRAVAQHLQSLQIPYADRELMDVVMDAAKGKTVLDIGVVAHNRRYIDSPQWRHRMLRNVSKHILGIDILKDLIEELKGEGFNVRQVDAMSETDLNERFDLVFIGDVIEHVDNPSLLLKFAARHMTKGGRILVATPNPFSRKFVRQFLREGVMVTNLDHVAWFTPGMALELGRRLGLELTGVHLAKAFKPFSRRIRTLAWSMPFLRMPMEYSFPDYLFEYSGSRTEAPS